MTHATGPNLPPLEPHPEPAEILAPPVAIEPVPEVNDRLTEAEHSGHMVHANRLVEEMRKHYQRRNIFEDHRGRGSYATPAEAAAVEAQLDTQLAGIRDGMRTLAWSGDTRTILNRFSFQAGAQEHEHQLRNVGIGNRDATIDQASDAAAFARGAANITRADKESLTVRLFSETMAVPIADPAHPTAAETAELNRVMANREPLQAALTVGQHNSARAAVAATKLEQSRDRHHHNTAMREGFHDELADIAADLRAEHDGHYNYIRSMVNMATQNMRSWNIQEGENYPGQSDSLRIQLQYVSDALQDPNRLGSSDSARAELLGDYVRLRYRLEARGIHLRDPSVPGPVFTEDGGIRVHEGSAEETVVYANGDSTRTSDIDPKIDPSGNPIRRNPAGNPVAPEDIPAVDLSTPSTRPQTETTETLFNTWEESRTPADALEAHTALMNDIRGMQHRDDQLSARANVINTRLVEVPAELRANQLAQATIGTPSTPQEASELLRLQNEASRLRTEETSLRAEAPVVIGARRRVREQLNPAQYARSLIEVGATLPAQEAQPRGVRRMARRVLGRTVEIAIDTPPEFQEDGSVTRNMTLNGSTGEWRLHPDGRSTRIVERFDPRTGRAIFNPRTGDNYWQENREPDGSLYAPARYW
jgi:hypothetical protein